ncbi:MAG: RNA-guided endonuclease TnpB family protein, partial [Candidatus Aenigmarchaeota archaeon]|nr:RNA-guided endonuclease TnpB family protein [Candidatus Aenigmarchaeota archaeon]
IKHFLTDSDGLQIENLNLDKFYKRVGREQKKLSRKEKDSRKREKQRIRVAKLHEKIVNQREDFLHKLSRYYVDNYDFIAVEDLNIKNMVRNHYLSKHISDVSWRRFVGMLSYKAENAGKVVVKVDPRGTSQEYKFGKLDKDYNASLNILKRGLEKLGMGQAEFTPVETRPLPIRASSVVESGSSLHSWE